VTNAEDREVTNAEDGENRLTLLFLSEPSAVSAFRSF
jgi:hypothetical protein